MKKRLLAGLLTGTMVISLAACGTGGGTSTTEKAKDTAAATEAKAEVKTEAKTEAVKAETAEETEKASEAKAEAKSGEEITITVASRYGSDTPNEVFYRKKVQEFNDMDNGIKVVMDNIPTESDYLDKLRTSFANGDTPNVFIEYGGSRTLDYLESDALVNMKPYFDEDKEWKDSFYTTMFKDLDYTSRGYEGIWGVPFASYAVSLFYNKEIFEQQGLTPPTTWDDLMNVCEKLKTAGIRPFQVGEKDIWRLGHLHNNIVAKSLGADAAQKLADRSLTYDSPEMLKTYHLISDMVSKEYLGTDILNTDYNTEKATFLSGDCAMRWDGSWYVSEIYGTDIYDKTGAVPFPYIDEKYKDDAQGGASDMWFVSKLKKSDEEIKASVEFLKFMTSQQYFAETNEVAALLYPAKFTPTPNTPANPLLDEVKDIVGKYKNMLTDIQNSDPESHMLDTVRNALQGLALGNTPEQCGKDIVSSITGE